jgi:hypothetical protein
MRARKFMSEVLLDQIPNLSELQRFLDQLAISAPPESGQLHLHRLLRQSRPLYRSSFHRVLCSLLRSARVPRSGSPGKHHENNQMARSQCREQFAQILPASLLCCR